MCENYLYYSYISFVYRGNDAARATVVAELAEVDALPCAEVETAVGDGYGDAHAEEAALGMGRHVVRSFKDVVVVWLVFLHEVVEYL